MEHQSGLNASKAMVILPPMGGARRKTKTMSIKEKIIRTKVGLLNLAEELGNVSKACQMMGLSRDTFYRYKSAT